MQKTHLFGLIGAAVALAASAFALVLGVMLGNTVTWPAALEIYDRIYPVATLNVEVKTRAADSITVALSGERHHNRDCAYKGIFAYTKLGAVMRDVNIVRTDRKSTWANKPPGVHDFGTWMLWPVDGVGGVVIYVRYDCGGRDVFVQTEEIRL